MSRRVVALLALASGLLSREAFARPRRDMTLSASLAVALPSAYQEALDSFGRDGPSVGTTLETHVTLTNTRWWRFGVRGGWTRWSTDARQGEFYNRIAMGSMDFHLIDAGVYARFVMVDDRSNRLRLHLDLEGGATLGIITLGWVDQYTVMPRVGASIFIGAHADHALYGLRLGYQHVPWGGAGGSVLDPAFSAIFVGLEVGWSQW